MSAAGPDAVQAVASTADRGARIVAVAIALTWHTTIGLPAVLVHASDLRLAWVVGGGWLLVAGIGVFTAGRLLRGGNVPAWPLATVLLAVDAAVFPGCGGAHLFTTANWAWGTLGWFFVLVLWQRSTAALIGVLGAHSAIALTALTGYDATGAADLSRYAMYVYGTSTLPVAVFTGRNVIAAQSRHRAATAAARATVEAERDAAEQARHDREARLGLVSAAAGTVLTELADGRADPADPAVQRRCALAAARLRRLIAESDDVPDPLLHELRAAADLAERNGAPVELVTVGSLPPLPVEIRRRLAEPLTEVLAGAHGPIRLTVMAHPDEVVVSVVTPVGVDATGPSTVDRESGGVRYVYERDEELTWVQTRWRAR